MKKRQYLEYFIHSITGETQGLSEELIRDDAKEFLERLDSFGLEIKRKN